MTPYRYVDSARQLRDVVDALCAEPRFALDTEFHSERTYVPQVALIQIAWPGNVVLIDPLEVDVSCLAEVLQHDPLMVAHAASQDLEVLELCCGTMPRRIFDTQIASGFVGGGKPSLASLYGTEIGWRPAKADRLTDWLVRPLKASQLKYAANDVAHLLEVHDRLAARLDEMGRLSWAEEEFELLLERIPRQRDPEDAWSKLKDVRHLRKSDLPVLRAVAAWREQMAAKTNHPARHVISDQATVSIAQAKPRTVEELAQVRGVGRGVAAGRYGKPILEAVAAGIESTWRPPRLPHKRSDVLERLRPAIGLVTSWLAQLARERMIEPSLLATRADVEAFVRGEPDARLLRGWRYEMMGEPIRSLVAGKAALAFDGDVLVMERRSGLPLHRSD